MLIFEDLTKVIIGCFYKVYNTLGYGFLEQVYEKAMLYELSKHNIEVESQAPISVYYEKVIVGDYLADILVENRVILELKAVAQLIPVHEAQLINYLKATGINIGFLMNFGKEAEYKRLVY